MYNAGTARGRVGDDAEAQVTFTKEMGDTAFELTANSGPDGDKGDTVILRPVVTYAADSVSLAVGAEVPVVDQDEDQDWYGFGATTTVTLTDDLAVNARVAYRTDDDSDTDSMTAGIGAQYANAYLAVVYGEDDADNNAADAEELQVYASYKIPAVMDIDNLDIYLAAAYSEGEVNSSDVDDVTGARIRVKYVF